MIEIPRCLSSAIVWKRAFFSRLESEVVGSSKIMMRAFFMSAFEISTICRTPAESSSTLVSGVTGREKRSMDS